FEFKNKIQTKIKNKKKMGATFAREENTIEKEILNKLQNNHPTLTGLDLQYKQLGETAAKVLALSLEKNTTLTTLNLDNNEIGEDNLKKISGLLDLNMKARTSFFEAAFNGDLFQVKRNLQSGVSIHGTNEKSMTVLHLASQEGHIE